MNTPAPSTSQLGAISRGLQLGLGSATLVVVGFLVWSSLQPKSPEQQMEAHAEEFVELALALGWHRELEIDSYFGLEFLDRRNASSGPAIPEIKKAAENLLLQVEGNTEFGDGQRQHLLQSKLERFLLLLDSITASQSLSFNEQVSQLYELSPAADLTRLADISDEENLASIEELLPGRGTLSFRVAAYRNQLIIPADKRRVVFEAALKECRARTAAHWKLPAAESIKIEWTRDVSAAWHQYNGNYQSTLRVNDLAIAFINSAIDVACHEGYPGHHAQFVMMEAAKGDSGFVTEDTVVLLRTPSSVIREGAANYGVGLVFPLAERIKFEREVLAPLAGFSFPEETKYSQFLTLMTAFGDKITPLLRDYLDGELSFNAASNRLGREALVPSPNELLRFADEFGAFGVGYQIAQRRLENNLAGAADEWDALLELIVNPESRL